jgi:hypothetical protein
MGVRSVWDESRRVRWMGAGTSKQTDARAAAAEAAMQARQGDDVALAVVFTSIEDGLDAVVEEVNRVTGGAPLIGCSTAGELSDAGATDAIVVAMIGGEGFRVTTGVGRDASRCLREAGAEAVRAATEDPSDGHEVVVLLSDGLSGDQREVVRGAYSMIGAAVPLVGGCAGDSLRMEQTRQLHGSEVLTDCVIAARITSDAPMGIGVRHGWRKVGDPMVVTSSSDNHVLTIDHRPALDVYLERLGAPDDARRDPGAFTRFALRRPLGLDHRSGVEVRFVAGADFEARSLRCIAEVPQGALSWIMEGDEESVLSATDAACDAAVAALDGASPLGFLAFDCIARRNVLGDEHIDREVDRVRARATGAPVAGFYTYGEFARTRGATGFHNQTLVVLALA